MSVEILLAVIAVLLALSTFLLKDMHSTFKSNQETLIKMAQDQAAAQVKLQDVVTDIVEIKKSDAEDKASIIKILIKMAEFDGYLKQR
jgi:hypothetical protein